MRLIYTLAITCLLGLCYGQEDFNLELIAQVEYPEAGNDIWGFVGSDSTEYAIVGTADNTRIYNLSDPANPREIITIAGSNTIWRDMKSWEDHVYVTADNSPDGLLVVDMSEAATDSIRFQFLKPQVTTANGERTLGSCHNIYIDENGFAYLAGCDTDMNKAIIFDLNQDKWTPPIVGVHGGGQNDYAHDLMVRNNIMYSSEIYAGNLVIWDVTDKANIEFLGETPTSFTFTHNTWISDDGKYAFTTDELDNAFVDAYDISDFNNIKRIDKFQPLETAGQDVVPHNTHYIDEYLVTSWYTDGVVITDASRPDNLIKVGAYDTWPDANGGTNGCWGAYPWLPSGLVLANDRRYGLFVLQPTYVRGCYLEGNVTDASDGSIISDVDVMIVTDEMNEGMTNAEGDYKTGLAEGGTYDVIFSHPDYNVLETQATLDNGVLTILDVQLVGSPAVLLTGKVISSVTGAAIPNGIVKFTGERRELTAVADAGGIFTLSAFEEPYEVVAGAWGYLHKVDQNYQASTEEIVFELDPGYQDDFVLDQGWVVSGDAPAGIWERGVPFGTVFQGRISNIGEDIRGDIGDMAYVTGNSSEGTVGEDDVDDGSTILTSPVMDLTTYDAPVIEFRTFFFNRGGGSEPNDDMTISVTDGTTTNMVLTYDQDTEDWTDLVRINLSELGLDLSAPISISYSANDNAEGHLVEAALDVFKVIEASSVNVEELSAYDQIKVYPNPTSDFIIIDDIGVEISKIRIFNINGQKVLETLNVSKIDVSAYNSGIYTLVMDTEAGKSYSTMITVK